MKNKKTKNLNKVNIVVNKYLLIKTFLYKLFVQPYVSYKYSLKPVRFLEIGPGKTRIKNFETLNTLLINETDFIGQLGGKLPFKDESFDLIYMSHVLEHIFWYKLDDTMDELVRILKPNGKIEIWVPDGEKIAQAFVDAEKGLNKDFASDNWYRFNSEKDPCVWYSGRVHAYGDGYSSTANNHYNIHLSSFSKRFLKKLLQKHGFDEIRDLSHEECRGCDHGWINLGVTGQKR